MHEGLVLLQIVLSKLRPDVRVNAINEIKKIQGIKPNNFGNNVSLWLLELDRRRNIVEVKAPGCYPINQYLMDIFKGALEVPSKTFNAQVSSKKQDWLLGEDPGKFSKDYVMSLLTKYHNNMVDDGTWEKELSETTQIIALATQVEQLKAEVNRTTIALATVSTKKEALSGADAGAPSINRRGKRQPYTVKEFRLQFKGDSIMVGGQQYFWCVKDHYSGGQKYNGMYCLHKTDEHDAWRKELDELKHKQRQARGSSAPRTSTTAPKPDGDAEKKKLALSESLRTALCTQAGLTQDVADRIWNEACKESGNA